jgi:hypothetical protein
VPTLTDGSLSKLDHSGFQMLHQCKSQTRFPGSHSPLWTKRWKSFSWSCFGIPGPVSSHSKRRVSYHSQSNFSVLGASADYYLMLFKVSAQYYSIRSSTTVSTIAITVIMSLTHSFDVRQTCCMMRVSPYPLGPSLCCIYELRPHYGRMA